MANDAEAIRTATAFTTTTHLQQETTRTRTIAEIDDHREQRITRLLQTVPTFTIVDASGVPYMVVGEDAKVTAYFFTSYAEAFRILQLAIQSAEEESNISSVVDSTISKSRSSSSSNPWKQARISSVPLDTAVGLTLKSSNGSFRSYFQVAASARAIDDALSMTGETDLAETKVPLFYVTTNCTLNGRTFQNNNTTKHHHHPYSSNHHRMIMLFK
jgi:hypothetical protein